MDDRRDGVEEGERVGAGFARRSPSASEGAVSGPVAMIAWSQSAGGSPATSSRAIVISGCASSLAVTAAEKPSRSTASAPPAGTWLASPDAMISEPASRISACSSPTALFSASSERKELEQTSSARLSVLCASVPRTGRISCRMTGTPASAACQAASEPARPPPTMWIGFMFMAVGNNALTLRNAIADHQLAMRLRSRHDCGLVVGQNRRYLRRLAAAIRPLPSAARPRRHVVSCIHASDDHSVCHGYGCSFPLEAGAGAGRRAAVPVDHAGRARARQKPSAPRSRRRSSISRSGPSR